MRRRLARGSHLQSLFLLLPRLWLAEGRDRRSISRPQRQPARVAPGDDPAKQQAKFGAHRLSGRPGHL